MLFSLLNGKEKSSLNLFCDTNGRHLPKSIIRNLSSRSSNVIVLCYHQSPSVYEESLNIDGSRCSYYNGFDDPLNWLSESFSSFEKLQKTIDALRCNQSSDTIVVIDDLRMFLRSSKYMDNNGDWNGAFTFLKRLSQLYQLYLFVNPTLVPDSFLQELQYICSLCATCTLQQNDLKASATVYCCDAVLKKNSGKVVAESQLIVIETDGKMTPRSIKSRENTHSAASNDEVDPASNLTFNLRLSHNEKEARANTSLPYILNETSKASYLKHSNVIAGGGGDVIYEPDDADDFDEEDPDDDLDI